MWVTTNEDSKSANNSQVHLVVYGQDGKTDPIILTDLEGEKKEGDEGKKEGEEKGKEEGKEKEHKYFEAGKTDEFDVSIHDHLMNFSTNKIKLCDQKKKIWFTDTVDQIITHQVHKQYAYSFTLWPCVSNFF